MSRGKSRRRTPLLIAATVGALAVLLTLITAPIEVHAATAPTKYYAAFAYAIAERVSVVDAGTTADNALGAAESTCRQKGGGVDCQAVGWWRSGLGSFAIGPNNQWGWGTTSTTIEEADRLALSHCGKDCQLTIRTGIAAAPSSPWAWRTAAPLRGNWYVAGYTEGVADHTGRDLWAVDFFSDATAVYPTRAGKVVYSDYNSETVPPGCPISCYGWTVAVDHGAGLYSIYTHLKEKGASFGQQVTPSTQIGVMSDSGCKGCGVHLHYAMHIGKSGLSGRDALWNSSLQPVRTPWHKP